MKTILLVTVLCVLVSCLHAEEDTAARRRRGKKEPKEGCSGWTWQPCVPANGDCGWGQRQGTQEGPNCKILSKTIRCRLPCGRRKEYGDCRYRVGEPWECDADTNMETRTLQLKRAIKGVTCDPEVTETRPCKGACKYSKKQVTECDEESNTFTITKQLRVGDPAICKEQIMKTKRCKNGDEEGKGARKAEKKAARKAARKEKKARKQAENGEAATPKGPCQYGSWSEFGECVDNKQTRTRPIMSGAEKRKCQQRATQVRNC